MHLKLVFIITFALSCTVCTGCARNTTPITRTDFYFDTVIQITLYDTDDESVLDGCFSLAEKYENLFSATKEGSDVWNINHAGGKTVTVSEETAALLVTAADYANTTEGVIDPTIRPLSEIGRASCRERVYTPV